MTHAGHRSRAQRPTVAVAGRAGKRCSASAPASGFIGAPGRSLNGRSPPTGTRCSARSELTPGVVSALRRRDAGAQADVRRSRPLPVPPPVLPDRSGRAADPRRRRDASPHAGERVVEAAHRPRRRCFEQLGITEAEDRPRPRSIPATRRRARRRASTRSCCPDSLHFAEYNAESPAGPRLHAAALPSCSTSLPVMDRFRQGRDGPVSPRRSTPCSTRCSPAMREWGGTAHAADDRDRRLARGADLDRVRDPAGRLLDALACRR